MPLDVAVSLLILRRGDRGQLSPQVMLKYNPLLNKTQMFQIHKQSHKRGSIMGTSSLTKRKSTQLALKHGFLEPLSMCG